MSPKQRLILLMALVLIDGGGALFGIWIGLGALSGKGVVLALSYLFWTSILGLTDPGHTPRVATIVFGVVLSILFFTAGGLLALGTLPASAILVIFATSAFGRLLLAALARLTATPVWVAGLGPKSTRLGLALRRQIYGSRRLAGFVCDKGPNEILGAPRLSSDRSDGKMVLQATQLDGSHHEENYDLGAPEGPGDGASFRIKRTVDVMLAIVALPFVAIFVALVVVLLIATGYGQPFYSQIRITQNGRRFSIYKLRTMPQDAEPDDEPVWPKAEDPRVSGAGNILRRLWLDELPQILNVLRGDLSWVGPRPERPEFTQVFTKGLPKYGLRHQTLAGMTGLAQVRGFVGNTSLRKRLSCDLEYIRDWTPWLDVEVLLRTICQVIVRHKQPVFDFVPGRGDRIP